MREYTAREMKLLKANPYTYRVTKNKLYFTAEFKQAFWIGYQAGNTPRKLLAEFGYDLSLFGRKQIDSIAQRIKEQAQSGKGFKEGEAHDQRPGMKLDEVPESMERIWIELQYLRQEVEFLKKIMKGDACRRGKGS